MVHGSTNPLIQDSGRCQIFLNNQIGYRTKEIEIKIREYSRVVKIWVSVSLRAQGARKKRIAE